MIELETSLLPELTDCIQFWKRYIDDTICFIKVRLFNYILSVLNNFDINIKFTYELEHEGKLPFLDVLLCRVGLYTTVYICTKLLEKRYKTLKTLKERAYLICLICSTDELRNRELKHIEKIFYESNSCPNYVNKQVLQQISEKPGIWKGNGWESRRFMLAFYSILFWKRLPLMFYPSYENGGKILSVEKPPVGRWLWN